MYFLPILFALLAFLAVFAVHAAIYRIYTPESEDKFVILLYLGIPLGLFLLSAMFRPTPWPAGTACFLLYFAIAAGWVGSYPAIYASCPSLILSYFISQRPSGLSLEELSSLLDLKTSSAARIEDAQKHHWIEKEGEGWQLTAAGKIFYHLFALYRRILGRGFDPL